MVARDYEDYDYEVIKDWWIGHNWNAIPIDFLPRTGVVVEDEDSMYCAVWIYADSTSPRGMMEWLVTNPENKPRESVKAINLILKAVLEKAVYMDLKALMTSVNNKGLIKMYNKYQFNVTDTDMKNMLRII